VRRARRWLQGRMAAGAGMRAKCPPPGGSHIQAGLPSRTALSQFNQADI
jgi:hypothetical protein